MSKPIDKHDAKLLASLSEDGFTFPRGASSVNRAFDLATHGLVEKKFDVYRVSAGRKSVEVRPCFRRTEAGTKALDAMGVRIA